MANSRDITRVRKCAGWCFMILCKSWLLVKRTNCPFILCRCMYVSWTSMIWGIKKHNIYDSIMYNINAKFAHYWNLTLNDLIQSFSIQVDRSCTCVPIVYIQNSCLLKYLTFLMWHFFYFSYSVYLRFYGLSWTRSVGSITYLVWSSSIGFTAWLHLHPSARTSSAWVYSVETRYSIFLI